MFAKQLIVVAAAVAIAIRPVSALDEASTHIRVHLRAHERPQVVVEPVLKKKGKNWNDDSDDVVATVRAHKKEHHYEEDDDDTEGSSSIECGEGETPVSVEDIGTFCAVGEEICAGRDGACPGPQEGLEYGSKCDYVKTGVLGCKAISKDEPETTPIDEDVVCEKGYTPVSVEGVGTFCAEGETVCAGQDGVCPGPQDGLELGSKCDYVKTGVLGCIPVTEDEPETTPADGSDSEESTDETCVEGYTPVSVEGVGTFCTEGETICAGQDGACPGPQDGLELGSKCDFVKSGVLGCVAITTDEPETTPADGSDSEETNDGLTCDEGYTPVSVEGVGTFCTEGETICAGQDGACPGPQDGLELGSKCDYVKSGVLGCVAITTDEPETTPVDDGDDVECGDGETPVSVEGVGTFCASGDTICAGQDGACPGPQEGLRFGSTCDYVSSGALGCVPVSKEEYESGHADGNGHDDDKESECNEGESPISVEGVGTFCVAGDACAGVQGACPGPQDGLEFGSKCDYVASGVLGCIPITEDEPETTPVDDGNADCTGEDQSPMSVEGVGTFCVTGSPCAGVDGACPGPQPGLEYGSKCDYVASGVLGCKPVSKEEYDGSSKHHKAHHVAKKVVKTVHVRSKKADHKPTHMKVEHKSIVHKKVAHKKVVHKKVEHKTVHKKVEHKKVVHKKVEHKPVHKKVVHKAVAHKTLQHKHAAHKNVVHKPVHKKVVHKKVGHKPVVHKKAEHKVVHKKVESKTTHSAKKTEHHKVTHKKADAKHATKSAPHAVKKTEAKPAIRVHKKH